MTSFKRMVTLLWIVLAMLALTCGKRKAEIASKSVQKTASSPDGFTSAERQQLIRLYEAITDTKVNSTAVFLAGMKADSTDEFHSLRKHADWLSFHRQTELNWVRMNSKKEIIRNWAKAEFGRIVDLKRDVFYPFSGPDFLYVYTFFPNAGQYWFFGLEPPGSVPNLSGIPADSLKFVFQSLNRSLDHDLNLSFFVTKDMGVDLKGRYLHGTVPILMYFMARTHNRIISVQPVRLDTGGTVVSAEGLPRPKNTVNTGVEIRFISSRNMFVQKLTYLSLDVSDEGLQQNPIARRFLGRLDTGMTTYIKAASYLMHRPFFSEIRTNILSKSDCILEDDSSIPYRFFEPAVWNIALYGNYRNPIKSFRECVQPDLKAAIEKTAKPLSFHLGYGKESYLLMAVRKTGIQMK